MIGKPSNTTTKHTEVTNETHFKSYCSTNFNIDMLIIKEVKQRLENSTKMRDDDALLIADIWREQLAQLGAKSVYDVLNAIAGRMVDSPESIRRSRQKLQRDFPNLRGKVYQLRMEKEVEVLKELGYGKAMDN